MQLTAGRMSDVIRDFHSSAITVNHLELFIVTLTASDSLNPSDVRPSYITFFK